VTISRTRKTRELVLNCDICWDSNVRETFHRATTIADIAKWAHHRGWRIIHRGGWLYDHHCPRCELSRATSPGYVRRLHA
jgi:hypothetical protein